MAEPATRVDTMITHATLVTMNPSREIITDGALALRGQHIAGVGKTAEVEAQFDASETIDASRFVVTPGLINTHIHVTGEPLTKGFVPDDTDFQENVFVWLIPMYATYNEEDERISSQMAAAEMLRSGTTTILEAGTSRFTGAIVDGLTEIGIRARVGRWTWDLPSEPEVFRQTTDEAIAGLEQVVSAYRSVADGRIKAWTSLIGHTTCSDSLWKAAKEIADKNGTGMTFHMSPAALDPEGFLERYGHRPMEHLAELGVLDDNVVIAHGIHVNDQEVKLLAQFNTTIAHCPTAALKEGYGATSAGMFPEMDEAGVNVALGTDGANSANHYDLLRTAYLVAGIYKDARRNPKLYTAERCLEMATLAGAQGLSALDEIGSLEVGKKADLVLHETNRPEWRPLINVAAQLVWSADGRSVHSVFVDGRRVVDDYHLTTIDEERLFDDAQRAGEAIIERVGLPLKIRWPVR
jgi:5-methylthioadenosine/S-adenosylhomocysteine deaminase